MSVADTLAPLSIRSVLRVNYAGEYGAVRIYQAQVLMARVIAPDLVPFLTNTLAHEIEHRNRFKRLMDARSVRPCAAMPLWGVGGYALGALTGMLGRNAILSCTEAVERTVHHHLDDQLQALGRDDMEVSDAIREIQREELGHLEFAADQMSPRRSLVARVVYPAVAACTALLIWLSTYGEALILRQRLHNRRQP